jgi:hypothetical protein
MRKSLWRWLPVLSVVLVSGACADTSTEMESAEPRETSAATETTSKPKPTKPEADAKPSLPVTTSGMSRVISPLES